MVKKKTKLFSLLFTNMRRMIVESFPQFISIILITATAVTLFVGLTSNAKSINNRVNEIYDKTNVADIWVTVSQYDKKDEEAILNLLGPNGQIEKRYTMDTTINNNPATGIIIDALPSINTPYTTDNEAQHDFFIIDNYFVKGEMPTDSRWINPDGSYANVDIELSFTAIRDYLSSYQISPLFPGKTVLDVFEASTKEGKTNVLDNSYLSFNAQVTGSMIFPENVSASSFGDSSFYIDKALVKRKISELLWDNYAAPTSCDDDNALWRMAIMDGSLLSGCIDQIVDAISYNQYIGVADESIDTKTLNNKVQEYFASKEQNNLLYSVDLEHFSSNITVQSDIVQARQLAYIFPMVFFLVAILVVLTTISQVIIKERPQIGTMKALGLTSSQIFAYYLILTISLILIGLIIGIILGPIILPWVMNKKYDILYSLPKMRYVISWREVIYSSLFCLGVACIVTYLVVHKEATLLPSESMRPRIIKSLKHSGKMKTKESSHLLTVKMAFRNIRLNIVKSAMVVIGVAGCTALLVCGFGIDDTLSYGVDHDTWQLYSSNIVCNYSGIYSQKEEILNIDGVESVAEYALLPTTTQGSQQYTTYIYLLDNTCTFFHTDDVDYRLQDKVVITQKIAEGAGVGVGDKLKFSILGSTYELEVDHIIDAFYFHGVFINIDYGDYGEVENYKTIGCVDVKDGYDPEEVNDRINELSGISISRTKEGNRKLINSYMSAIAMMTMAIKVFAIVLAVITLYNLALLNIRERSRNIATLKVLGFNQIEIMRSLVLETMSLTILGVIAGLFLGEPLQILVLSVNRTPVVEFLYTTYNWTYIKAFILSFGVALVVNFILTFRAKKIKMVESLKSVD